MPSDQERSTEWDIPAVVCLDALEALAAAIEKPFTAPEGHYFVTEHNDAMRVLLALNMQGWDLTPLPRRESAHDGKPGDGSTGEELPQT